MKPTRLKWYNSIRVKIPVIIIVIIMIPVFIFYQYSHASLLSNVRSSTETIVQSGLSNLSMSIEYMTKKITSFATEQVNNSELIALIDAYVYGTGAEKTRARSRLTLYLSQSVYSNNLLESVFLVEEGGQNIVTTVYGSKEITVDSPQGRAIYAEYTNDKVNAITWYASQNPLSNYQKKLAYIRPVRLDRPEAPNISLIYIMEVKDLLLMVDSTTLTGGYVVVSDYKGQMMLSSDDQSFTDGLFTTSPLSSILASAADTDAFITDIEGREYLIVTMTSLETSWKYKQIIPMDVLYGNLQSQMYIIYLIIFVSLLVAVVGAMLVAIYVIRPINNLVAGLKNLEAGQLVLLADKKRNDELGAMTKGYNTMVQKLKSLIEELYVKELLRKEAQVRSYQSQINEHFLYNVLNSIYCIAKKENANKAADSIDVLSKYFRRSLAEGHDFVTVEDVVELIKNYMWIQKVRYGERFQYEIQVEKNILHKYVLKYLFQPIVENAIIHGIEERQACGIIRISFEADNDLLVFAVTDNGAGFSETKLEELCKIFEKHTRIEGDNFALNNINAQIKIVYGEQYGIRITSIPLEETVVSFEIPMKESGGKANG